MNKAIIKKDNIQTRIENMTACGTKGAKFSADWRKGQDVKVYKQSLIDCYTVFTKSKLTKDVREDYKGLADECLLLMGDYITITPEKVTTQLVKDKALQSFVCFQFERYAQRILYGSRDVLHVEGLGFSVPEKKSKETKAPAKQERNEPVKQEPEAPVAQENSDVLQQILAGVNSLNTRMERVEQGMEELSTRVTALENKPKRRSRKAEAEAKENVES